MTPEEDLMQRVSAAEASNWGIDAAEKGAREDQVHPNSPEADDSVSDGVRLAEWLNAQVQLPGYVADDDWTPQHTQEFASFCADPDRKFWFVWMAHPAEPSGRDFKNALGQEGESMSHKRLAFANQLPSDRFTQLLKPGVAREESDETFVYIVKKALTVVLSRPLEDQLLCLSLHGPVLQQIALIIRGVCIPLLRENCLWPESLKKGLLRRLSCYAGQLNEVAKRTNGCNTLALPSEDLSDITECLTDRDLMQRLERLVLSWTCQVKEILSLQDEADASLDSGHLGEIQRWTEHSQNLHALMKQFQEPAIQEILNALEAANSSSVEPFLLVQEDVAAASRIADDNLRFLQVLRAPCHALSEADLEQIPNIIAELLMAVRIVATHSEYYTTPGRIRGLLRNIACEVIRRGQASIDVDAMWAGDVAGPMESLKHVIQWGLVLNKLFKQISTLIKAEGKAPCTWDFADRAAFAESDAFVQRCRDLLDVCLAQLQFNPTAQVNCREAASGSKEGRNAEPQPGQTYFGHSCLPFFGAFQTEAIRSSIKELQEVFGKSLSRLKAMGRRVLQVKETMWHSEYALFRAQVRDQECMYTNIITTAFKRVFTVEEACEIYEAFQLLAKRPSIQRFLEKKAADVWKLFSEASIAEDPTFYCGIHLDTGHSVICIKRQFDLMKKSRASFLATKLLHPYRSGASLWCRGATTHLQRQLQALREIGLPADSKDAEHALELHNDTSNALQNFVERSFQEWLQDMENIKLSGQNTQAAELPQFGCDINILTRGKGGCLELNFDKGLQRGLQEAHFWQYLQGRTIRLPFAVIELMKHQDRVFLLQQHVLQPDERRLFQQHLAALDRKAALGIQRLTWNSKGIKEIFVRDMWKDCQLVTEHVNRFQNAKKRICAVIQASASTHLIGVDKKATLELDHFLLQQEQARSSALSTLNAHYSDIVSQAKAVEELFVDQTKDVQKEWTAFIDKIDLDWREALRKAIQSSLLDLATALSPKESRRSSIDSLPLLRIFAVLDTCARADTSSQMTFDPSMGRLSTAIEGICRDAMLTLSRVPKLCSSFEPNFGLNGWSVRVVADECVPPKICSWYPEIICDEKCNKLTAQISRSVSGTSHKLSERLQWWSTSYLRLLGETEEALKLLLQRSEHPLQLVMTLIQQYSDYKADIQQEESKTIIIFLESDFSQLKHSLLEYCHLRQEFLTTYLHENARKEHDAIFDFVESNRQALEQIPASTDELRVKVNLCSKCKEHLPVLRSKITPIEQQFNTLRDLGVSVSDEEHEKVLKLHPALDAFEATLEAAETMLTRTKKAMKVDAEVLINSLDRQASELFKQFIASAPFDGATFSYDTATAFAALQGYKLDLNNLKESREQLAPTLDFLGIENNTNTDITQMENDSEKLGIVWAMKAEWDGAWESMSKEPFYSLDVPKLQAFGDTLAGRLLEVKEGKAWPIWRKVYGEIEQFRQTLPLVSNLLNPAIRDRHWERIKMEVAERFDQHSDTFNMKAVFQYELLRRSDLVARLAEEARKELKIEMALDEIVATWSSFQLKILPYKNNMLRMEIDEDFLTTLEEHLISLSTIKSDQFHLPFKEFVSRWETTLTVVSEVLELLQQVQRQWMYLENVFRGKTIDKARLDGFLGTIIPVCRMLFCIGSDDVRILLPQEATLFDRTDRLYYYTLLGFQQESTLVNGCTQDGIKEELRLMNDDLEDIRKSLDDFLERKRQEFPRFYFVSNSDMLEILGNAKHPERVQKHIKKCFQGIKSLELVPPGRRGARCWEADGFVSAEGERLRFAPRPLAIEGGVEQWLNKVTRAMRETLKKQLLAVHQQSMAHGAKKEKWIKENCFQLVITSSQITWNMETEGALRRIARGNKMALKSLKRQQSHQLLHLTELVRKAGSGKERMKLNALVTVEVHNRDIQANVFQELLIQSRCESEHHFAWTSQLRLELREDIAEAGVGGPLFTSQMSFSGVVVCHCLQMETMTPYGYEYQGIYSRLVITPLTDQCFMALTFALHFKLGGSCQGPAGTGKTETVKDLGKTLARFVIVFNCSDALDYLSLGRILSGLAQSGAWCCFDEFNRIGVEVLSVVAQQISTIQNALREVNPDDQTQKKFFFEGQRVRLDTRCGIFTTMNPGYKGRAELPDNLKSLFRPIPMMTPDAALICEILLMAEGYDSARELSKKAVALFQLMAQQLSKQDHYDFGLRPIRSALQRAGEIKRQGSENISEQMIIIQAITDTVLPKTVSEDVEVLFALIKDIFPEADVVARESEALRGALEAVVEKRGLTKVDYQVLKAQQLSQCIQTRHGNMLVGSTLSGKSTDTWRLHCSSAPFLGLDYNSVKTHVLNPKSLNGTELYGGFSTTTREWTDGIFSSLLRTCCNEVQQQQRCGRWVVLDGPVDTTWVESMNSLLDDNKTLTLTNGDRIELHSQVSLLFEVEDLSAASPATVSRVGIIFMDASTLGWRPYVEAWIARQFTGAEAARLCRSLFDKYVPKLLQVRCLLVLGVLHSACANELHKFHSLSRRRRAEIERSCHAENFESYHSLMEKLFLFSVVWSTGGIVAGSSRSHVDLVIRQLSNSFPPSHTVYDYGLSAEKGDWTLWEERVPSPYRPLEGMPFHRIFVPTADVVCQSFLLGSLIRNNVHALAVGARGCGKTSCIQKAVLHDLPDSVYSTFSLTFSSQTSSREAQESFESKLEKRVKGTWGPPGRKSLVCFIDDLNMPKPDEFGSQPPLELLRHFLEYGCWYDRSQQSLKMVLDLHFLAAMGTPEGGRASISPRLQSCFNIVPFLAPNSAQVNRIYQTLIVHKFSDFKEDVKSIAESIAAATVALHQCVSQAFKPKPEKPHYLFSMRNMSKVVQGLYQADSRCIEDREVFLKLWYHECQRVYQDRLASPADADRFLDILDSLLEKSFQIRIKDLTKDKSILFSHMRVEHSGTLTLGKYEEVQDRQALRSSLQLKLEEFNASSKTGALNLVLFREAIERCCRIHRMLSTPRGHMLLVGVGGSGRQSLSVFAVKLAKQELWRIHTARNYTINDFREELKQVVVKTGIDGKSTTLLVADKELKTDAFSDSLNSLISSGQIPGLFDLESLSLLLRDLQPAADAAKMSSDPDALLDFFVSRVKENLHVLLCVSPIGGRIKDYCRHTAIDWFFAWPQDALEEIATASLSSADLDFNAREAIACACSHVHMHAYEEAEAFRQEAKRTSFVTPTKFLRLVDGYRNMLISKRRGVHEKIQRLASGLSKLVEAREQVEAMNEELEAKKEDVAKKQRECDELMGVIAEKRMLADEQMRQVQPDSSRIQTEEVETKILSAEARRELAKAMPALEAAIDALEKLDKKSVAEVKAYTKPPELVMKTMAAVMTVMEKTPSWSQAKVELNDPGFLTRVKNFDKDSITNATLKKIEKYTKDPSFAPPNVQKVSRAAGALCLWVHAMQMYAEVYREVEPKRLKLRLAEEQLEKKQNDLRLARSRLDGIQGRLQELNNKYAESLDKKSELNNSAEELRVKLERAESLITGLADERDRWQLSLESSRAKLRNISGDALLGAAFMSYAGPFTSSYRARLVHLWIKSLQESKIPCSVEFDFTDFFVTPFEVRQWQLDGLPTDHFSAENGVLITKAFKWPLVIDPQNQANRWIRKLKAAENITVSKASKALLQILHLAVQTGRAVLLERLLTEIDPSLEALITKKIVLVNGNRFIRIGDQLVSYDNDFLLWMTTKIGNPLFPPEIEADVTLINFVIMEDGLTEQLLGIVVMKEEPSLEAHKHALVMRLADGRKRLQDIEDQILRLLTDARGCLLDDLELIGVLQVPTSLKPFGTLYTRIVLTVRRVLELHFECRPCGHRASVLYFVLQDLILADSMYQFSLDAYEDLFMESISNSKESNAVAASAEEHVLELNADHTLAVYRHARQGVFERHKLLLSLHLCASVLLSEDQMNRQEYSFLFTCEALTDGPPLPCNPDPEWITQAAWQRICRADKLESLQGLQSSVEQNLREWRRWFGSQEPERATLPGDWQTRLEALQRLVVIRCLRPDRFIPAASRFVADATDAKFVESDPMDWGEILASSKSSVPLLFILSGVDPIGQLVAFANSRNTNVVTVALGQGQALRAEQVIRDGAYHGFWVYLANCHLAISWLPALEKLAEEILQSHVHPQFRLWLSSEPTDHFPIALLQRCTKITVERPRGLKANLQRLLQHRSEEEMQRVAGGDERYRRLFFSLCWLHSLLIERGKFHNVGWNSHASFSDTDFLIGDSLLATYCEQSINELPWEAIRFRIVGACYGGRLADERDMRLLRVYCNDCFNPQLLTSDFRFQGLPQYPMPDDTTINGFRQHVRDLPSKDPPEVFGQHVNAEIQVQLTETDDLLATLSKIQPSGAGPAEVGNNESRESRVSFCCDHLDQVFSQRLDLAPLQKQNAGNLSPLRIVMLQEGQRLNRLVMCVRDMVQQLRRAISGLLVMSEELEALQLSLLSGKVPQCWHFAFLSLKPLTSWAVDLAERLDQVNKWGQEHQPKAFWLGGLTYPSAFLTALLQQFARRNAVSIDSISFEFSTLTTYDENAAPSPPRDGAYVKRLYLEGASWNLEGMCLNEPVPMQLVQEMPIVHLKPVARKRLSSDSLYVCPVYIYPCRTGTSERPSLVTTQEIRSGTQDPSFWVKRGTALLLSTSS
ncbi:hypothetical protein Esti_000905 [Eimeria stiedai]